MSLRNTLIRELKRRKSIGVDQYEIEELMGFSKSTASEALSKLEAEGMIVRRKIAGKSKRVWLREYYPYYDPSIIRIGCLRSTEYARFLSIAMDYGERTGTRIMIRFYNDAGSLLQDISSGTLEFALAPIFTETLFALSQHNIVVVGPVASGGSGIFENPASSSSLIATSESTSMMLLSREFQKKHQNAKLVVFNDPVKARKDFEAGNFRYIAIWEPYASAIDGNKVYDYSDLMDSFPCCGISVPADRYKNGRLADVVSIYKNSEASIRSDIIDLLAKATKVGKGLVKKSLESYNFHLKYDMHSMMEYMDFIGYPTAEEAIKKVFLL
ncbi:hypothetical protein [Thermoplasma sp.]|uniref:hypothetical protein n=1 Tax=Thermoplasma sp. TaxID=1973142 RepID=UPI002622FCEB|nr:hypothetical protein [Thermoplasma sp.]